MPQNLPGFGYPHDNLSQQGLLSVQPHLYISINVATAAVLRLSMNHTTESANKNDITANWELRELGLAVLSGYRTST